MALILDTGPVVAWYDGSDRWHEATKALIDSERGALIMPSPVIPEVDYLLGRYIGAEGRAAFFTDLVAGVYLIEDVTAAGYRRIEELNLIYRAVGLGFVDAAVMALAEEKRLARVATIDRRHFSAVDLAVVLTLLP